MYIHCTHDSGHQNEALIDCEFNNSFNVHWADMHYNVHYDVYTHEESKPFECIICEINSDCKWLKLYYAGICQNWGYSSELS